MSDQKKPPPRTKFITIGAERYGLMMDFNALCDVEEQLEKPMASMIREVPGKEPVLDVTLPELRCLLWACLNSWVRRDKPQGRTLFSLLGAGDVLDAMIQEHGNEGVQAALAGAAGASFPDPEETDGGADPNA